jgi:hypothetical protein
MSDKELALFMLGVFLGTFFAVNIRTVLGI